METLFLIADIFAIIQTVSSAVMCVYGYKWSRGLIAVMSSYIGTVIGIIICYFLANSVGFGIITIIPFCAAGFSAYAYKNVKLNHFLAGFLLGTKISFMVLMKMAESGMIDDIGWLFILPIIIGAGAGELSSAMFSGYIVLACTAFLGAIELVPRIFKIINGTLFAATGDLSFIFDPISSLLSIFGIESLSGGEVIGIIAVTIGSFYSQKALAEKQGKTFENVIFDDRNLKQ